MLLNLVKLEELLLILKVLKDLVQKPEFCLAKINGEESWITIKW